MSDAWRRILIQTSIGTMSAQEERLVLLVQQHKELYDLSDKNYSNQEIKDNCWSEIAKEMKLTAFECKEKWKKLRDCFRKALKNRKSRSGDPAKKIKPWKLEKQMAFIICHMEERQQLSNIPDDIERSNDEDVEEVEDVHEENTANNLPNVNCNVSKTRRTQNTQKSKTSVADVLDAYLEKKNTVQKNYTNDALTQFFLSLAETVRNLPTDLQIQVKSQIFRTVNEAELTALQRTNTEYTNTELETQQLH